MWFFQADSILMSTFFSATVPVGSQTSQANLFSSARCIKLVICRLLNSDSLSFVSLRVSTEVNWLRLLSYLGQHFFPFGEGRRGCWSDWKKYMLLLTLSILAITSNPHRSWSVLMKHADILKTWKVRTVAFCLFSLWTWWSLRNRLFQMDCWPQSLALWWNEGCKCWVLPAPGNQ